MTIKEIKDYYKVSTYDRGKTLLLSHLTEKGKYNVSKFIVALEKMKSGVYRVKASTAPNTFKLGHSMETSNWDLLREIIKEHIDKYDFSSEFYNPIYREGYMEELAVHDYITDFLGFKSSGTQWGIITYSKELNGSYGGSQFEMNIIINGLLDSGRSSLGNYPEDNKVEVSYQIGEAASISVKVAKHPIEICKAIESLIKPVLLLNAAEMIIYLRRLDVSNMDIKRKTIKGLNVEVKDFKQTLIIELEKTLKALKG